MVNKDINIVIADDNIQFRANLKYYIENDLGCNVIAEASNGFEFLSLSHKVYPDIVLMDIVMDKMDGFETSKRVLWLNHHFKLIAMTMHNEIAYLDLLLEAGFKGCIFKYNIYTQLPTAIELVLGGNLYFPDKLVIKSKAL